MEINTYLPTTESKKQVNEHAEQKQTHRYGEHFEGFQIGRWLR